MSIEASKAPRHLKQLPAEYTPEYEKLLERLIKKVYWRIATFVPEKGFPLEEKKLGINITETGFVELVYKPGTPESLEEYNEMCEDFEKIKEQITDNFTNEFEAPSLLDMAVFVMVPESD